MHIAFSVTLSITPSVLQRDVPRNGGMNIRLAHRVSLFVMRYWSAGNGNETAFISFPLELF